MDSILRNSAVQNPAIVPAVALPINKKQGYELVTDGYPADLTFDNDDTTDQNFTVH
ncbi:mucin-binding protein [Limosilactobacillus fermentum]